MVSFHCTALRVGRSVSQWAEITRMAFGRSSIGPRCERKSRAGVSVSGSVGVPCDRKMLGIVMMASPVVLEVASGARGAQGMGAFAKQRLHEQRYDPERGILPAAGGVIEEEPGFAVHSGDCT